MPPSPEEKKDGDTGIIGIFISYSHHDRDLVAFDDTTERPLFIRHILPLEREGANFYWYDDFLLAGGLWDQEIRERLNSSKILLALISQDFLDSKYCTEVEVASILGDEKTRPGTVVPFYLSYCDWSNIPWLKKRTMLPSPKRPYRFLSDEDKSKELLRLRNHLQRLIRLIKNPTGGKG